MNAFLRIIAAAAVSLSAIIPMNATLRPRPLVPGDTIAILAPSGPIDSTIVRAAAAKIDSAGFAVKIYPHTFGKNGYCSGTVDERLADLTDAFTNPNVRAIICARGGYGFVHLLDSLQRLPLRDDPKWVVGFSDITAFHGLMASKGIESIHGLMCAGIRRGFGDPDIAAIFDIMQGRRNQVAFAPDARNHLGSARGQLLGGNLAVLAQLINTPFDLVQPGSILFIEDVGEPIYKMERILYQLRLSGAIDRLSGIIVGQFTNYKPDETFASMEEMIAQTLAPYNIPIVFNAPIGHVDHNVPVIESADVLLEVTADGVTLTYE